VEGVRRRAFHGEVYYSFDAILRDRSEFSLNTDTLTDGGFIVLSCTNIKDISKIVFKSDNAYLPTFCKNGSNVQALIPYPKDTNKDFLEFTVSYGASSKHFSVNLKGTPKEIAYSNEIADIIKDISSKAENTVYFQGNFISPLDNGFSAGYTFGDTVTAPDESVSITVFGNEYFSESAGQSVRALCSGNVISTGYCDALGNYMVIDHGLGLLSWYCQLSDFDSSVGKTLAVGDSVGKSGGVGFADTDGFLLLFTLKDELLDPSVLIQ
jgi:murein DD-endopeptidase MepM/ murein hydrolase activator NlpD